MSDASSESEAAEASSSSLWDNSFCIRAQGGSISQSPLVCRPLGNTELPVTDAPAIITPRAMPIGRLVSKTRGAFRFLRSRLHGRYFIRTIPLLDDAQDFPPRAQRRGVIVVAFVARVGSGVPAGLVGCKFAAAFAVLVSSMILARMFPSHVTDYRIAEDAASRDGMHLPSRQLLECLRLGVVTPVNTHGVVGRCHWTEANGFLFPGLVPRARRGILDTRSRVQKARATFRPL